MERGTNPVSDFFSTSVYFGLLLTLAAYQLPRFVNRKLGKERLNPLLCAILLCSLFLLALHIDYEDYYRGAQYIDFLLTPATICLAIPLYRQYALLKQNAKAVLLSCLSGVAAHMICCALLLALFHLEAAEYATLLPKSITTAIGKGLSEELGGYPAATMVSIIITGILGAVMAPTLLKLFRVTEPLAQGLAIGTSSHAAGTSRAVEIGEIQGAASSLAIVVTGLLTVAAAPLMMRLVQ